MNCPNLESFPLRCTPKRANPPQVSITKFSNFYVFLSLLYHKKYQSLPNSHLPSALVSQSLNTSQDFSFFWMSQILSRAPGTLYDATTLSTCSYNITNKLAPGTPVEQYTPFLQINTIIPTSKQNPRLSGVVQSSNKILKRESFHH